MNTQLQYKTPKENLPIILLLITLGIFARLVPHPANFTPIAAIALFAGAKIHQRWAYTIPLAVMLISDFFIGFHSTITYVYTSFILIALLGMWLKKSSSGIKIISSSILGSVIFFTITNFGVWLKTGMYPHTLEGLVRCYYMAIPFFRNTLTGDLVYTISIFGAYAIITHYNSAPQTKSILLNN